MGWGYFSDFYVRLCVCVNTDVTNSLGEHAVCNQAQIETRAVGALTHTVLPARFHKSEFVGYQTPVVRQILLYFSRCQSFSVTVSLCFGNGGRCVRFVPKPHLKVLWV